MVFQPVQCATRRALFPLTTWRGGTILCAPRSPERTGGTPFPRLAADELHRVTHRAGRLRQRPEMVPRADASARGSAGDTGAGIGDGALRGALLLCPPGRSSSAGRFVSRTGRAFAEPRPFGPRAERMAQGTPWKADSAIDHM